MVVDGRKKEISVRVGRILFLKLDFSHIMLPMLTRNRG